MEAHHSINQRKMETLKTKVGHVCTTTAIQKHVLCSIPLQFGVLKNSPVQTTGQMNCSMSHMKSQELAFPLWDGGNSQHTPQTILLLLRRISLKWRWELKFQHQLQPCCLLSSQPSHCPEHLLWNNWTPFPWRVCFLIYQLWSTMVCGGNPQHTLLKVC